LRFRILCVPYAPRGKPILEACHVILDVYNLALLNFDLILEYQSLGVELPHFSLFLTGGPIFD